MNYLHGHAEEEGEEVHDGEAGHQLSLQEHGGVVVVAVLHGEVVLVRSVHLVVHDDHVHHHAHHRHAEDEADQEGLPPPGRGLETDAGLGTILLRRAARSACGCRHLLLDLFAVVQVTGSAVSLHQRRFESQVLQRPVRP